MTDPRAHVAAQLREQAAACAAMGSPLYARLLAAAAEDVERSGPAWAVLSGHVAPGRGNAVALRFMAALHRLVLVGRAPRLARHYPSAGGCVGPGLGDDFREALAEHRAELTSLTRLPCQTNEVGRCAALVFGFLAVAARYRLPLRLLEVGASAGLGLRWDLFRYGGGGAAWGDPASPVQLTGLWRDAPEHLEADARVVARRGCDPRPLDPAREEDRLALQAAVWADQDARFARLRGALQLARHVPVAVDAASVDDWLPPLLSQPAPGAASVVYHSIVDEYLSADVRERFHATLRAAAARATAHAPLAWVRLEPMSDIREHAVHVTLWPSGQERCLAVCGAHGSDVTRLPRG